MKRFIKTYKDFLFEVRDKAIKHAGDDIDIVTKEEETEEVVNKYISKKKEHCPRCEEHIKNCKCETDDPWSTQNYHRT